MIFDVDGTIWDTTPVVAPAWNKALDECGCEAYHVTSDDLKQLFGKPMEEIISRILYDKSDEIRHKFKDLCYKYEEIAVGEKGGALYPNMAETLESLSKKYKLYIVSNCQSGYIELMLKKTGFGQYFSDHACYGDKGILNAENINLIVKRNSLENPVYIGDTQGDADASKKAGVKFVHASYGFGKVSEADFVIHDVSELISLE